MSLRGMGAVALIAATGLVGVGPSAAQAPAGDSVVGHGTVFTAFSITISASSGPSGEQPSGTYRSGGGTPTSSYAFDGAVTCLKVTGNIAVVGVYGTYSRRFGDPTRPPILVQDAAAYVYLRDNGPDIADATPDGISDPFMSGQPPVASSPPTDCAAQLPPPANMCDCFLSGGVTITDAPPPLPTSKDECKNGGWRSFGVFKYQGDCVSFVATGGKNPPAGSTKR
jgi:hypothetical protein